MKCDKCDFWGYSEKSVNIHKGRVHKKPLQYGGIDLFASGIIKRKPTRKEAKMIFDEVMNMGLDSPDARFQMVIIKLMELELE